MAAAGEVQDRQGCTPLHAAASGGHWEALAALLAGVPTARALRASSCCSGCCAFMRLKHAACLRWTGS